MISRLCNFVNVRKCASGERFVHIYDFHEKVRISNMSPRHSPELYFRFAHTNATFTMLLWLDSFLKNATPLRCFCTDYQKTAVKRMKITHNFYTSDTIELFCCVFEPRAACQIVSLLGFYNISLLRLSLLVDGL